MFSVIMFAICVTLCVVSPLIINAYYYNVKYSSVYMLHRMMYSNMNDLDLESGLYYGVKINRENISQYHSHLKYD